MIVYKNCRNIKQIKDSLRFNLKFKNLEKKNLARKPTFKN